MSTRGPSVKSTISNIERKNTEGDRAENGEKPVERSSGSIKAPKIPQIDSEEPQKDHIKR